MTRLKTTTSGSPMRSSIFAASLAVMMLLSCLSGAWAADGSGALIPEKSGALSEQAVLGFADSLFENKDYYRAITEYKRFGYLFPESPLTLNVEYKIGLSYFKGKKYEEAAEYFNNISIMPEKNEITKKALFKFADSYYKDKMYQAAAQKYRQFIKEYPDALEAHNAKYKTGWAYLHAGQYDDAKSSFREIGEDNPFYTPASNLSIELDRFEALPQKSPVLAGALSAIIPGAGQLYCGYYQDAIVSFLINGVFIWGTVELIEDENYAAGGAVGFFAMMWYTGNVFGAVSGAHKYNRNIKSDFIKGLDSKYNISLKYDKGTDSKFLVFNLRY